ncbi:MAG TPA: prepilin-type N-terminal cleavage/methylation domain-containing protein [Gammaproteobacteria bacterium]|nr:prepilin-type N-terminal cleavage/methylation domain-containing protein [Gammaproteobacteria bacterium]
MKTMKQWAVRGFTLIEMLLVMTIISAFIYASIGYIQQRTLALKIDRTAAQMQQILNAGLAYYVSNQQWPANLAALQAGGYLPASLPNPWNASPGYTISSTSALLQVSLTLPSALVNQSVIGAVLAGKLPLASSGTVVIPPVCPPLPAPCPPPTSQTTVVASVNIPGQNLNNATAVNFTGIYHNGACVPAPKCPTLPNGTAMVPSISVAPASVSGMNDGSTDVYPISSFTAYATGPSNYNNGWGSGGPPACMSDASANTACYSTVAGGATLPTGTYWRVCLQVVTQKGVVQWQSGTGQYATVTVLTRCTIPTENAGSSMGVFQQ